MSLSRNPWRWVSVKCWRRGGAGEGVFECRGATSVRWSCGEFKVRWGINGLKQEATCTAIDLTRATTITELEHEVAASKGKNRNVEVQSKASIVR